jgi:hypothetical protein
VALDTKLHDLMQPLVSWHETLEALHFTVTEDRPVGDDVALADCYENAVTDALSSLREALAHSRRAAAAPGQLDRVRHSLYRIHTCVNDTTHHCAVDMACWGRLRELDQLGRRRGPQWSSWSQTVHQSLERLPELSHEIQQALAACWQELAGSLPPNPAALDAAFKLRN